MKIYIERYPKSDEGEPEHFPNKKNTDVFNKEKIIAKLRELNLGIEKPLTLEDEAEEAELLRYSLTNAQNYGLDVQPLKPWVMASKPQRRYL